MKRVFVIACLAALLVSAVSGCGSQEITDSTVMESTSVNTESTAALTTDNGEMFTDRDYEVGYEESTSAAIRMDKTAITSSDDSVQIDGTTATITQEGTYLLSGTLTDGRIIVKVPDTAKVHLVLDGVQITSKTSAPLTILTGDKVFVTLAEHSENTLENGGTFEIDSEANIDGAVFSKQDLTFNGTGSLTVTSPSGNGIVCKDDLVFTSGTYTISSASHGLDVNDSVRIANAALTITAGKDGIHAENTDDADLGFFYMASGKLNITAEGDGVSSEAYLQLEGGTVQVIAGGGSENGDKASSGSYGQFMGGTPKPQAPDATTTETAKNMAAGGAEGETDTSTNDSSSMKGLKSTGRLVISGGEVTVNAADDAIHSNSDMTIDGGTLTLSTGDDGIHSDDSLTVTDGTIVIDESYEGLEATDLTISGGTLTIKATDDGLNAAGGTDESGVIGGRDAAFPGKGGMSSGNGSLTITGGSVAITADGDCIDANGSLTITGGDVTVSGANQGDTSILDFDTTGTISGGTFLGTGASSMTQNFSDTSTQGVILLSTGNQAAGTKITLTDDSGKTIISTTAQRDFPCVILSDKAIVSGKTYTLTIGEEETSITMDSTVYGAGNTGMMGGGKGMRR
ncbi:MAG: carbohydrate-binding domain-containing protein [Oscillospiraceae bacterium]|nr:carbohydrate-binding domain-containing protein [Oscillospiraceae bacterium]